MCEECSCLVLRLVEDFMRRAQSTQNVLTGISEEDAPLQEPDLRVGHHAGTRTCRVKGE